MKEFVTKTDQTQHSVKCKGHNESGFLSLDIYTCSSITHYSAAVLTVPWDESCLKYDTIQILY